LTGDSFKTTSGMAFLFRLCDDACAMKLPARLFALAAAHAMASLARLARHILPDEAGIAAVFVRRSQFGDIQRW
jgi:hypothetical protein